MKTSSRRLRPGPFVRWVPVGAVVAALFLVPSGTDAAARKAPELTVKIVGAAVTDPTPGNADLITTGGQLLEFSGKLPGGQQTIRLERRGNPNAVWTEVQDPSTGVGFRATTKADGSFKFTFPAVAMNKCHFRVVGSKGGPTTTHIFHSVFQEVALRGPTEVAVDNTLILVGDTVLRPADQRPQFPGRDAVLEERIGGQWHPVSTAQVDPASGKIVFPPVAGLEVGTHVFRAVLQDWTEGGDDIGWYPSHPIYVHAVPSLAKHRTTGGGR